MATATKHRKRWNKTELKLAQGKLPTREVARRIGRTEQAVASKRTELNAAGVRKSRRGKYKRMPVLNFAETETGPVLQSVSSVETFEHNGTVQDAVLEELKEQLDQVELDIDTITEELEGLQGQQDELIKKIADIESGRVSVEVRFVQ